MIGIPGSKSVAQRALLLASLNAQPTSLLNFPQCDDTKALRTALKKLGISITQEGGILTIVGGTWKKTDSRLDLKDNATGLRLLLGLCAGLAIEATLTGSKQLMQRPHDELIKALNEAGATITRHENIIHVSPQSLSSAPIKVPGHISSQFFSAAAIAQHAASLPQNIQIENEMVSRPYAKLTENLIETFKKKPEEFTIETDHSSITPFLLWSMLSKRTLVLPKLNFDSAQADLEVLQEFEKLGGQYIRHQEQTLFVPPQELSSQKSFDLKNCPDGALSLMLLAAFTPGPTQFSSFEHLKHKESNRLKEIISALNKMSAKTELSGSELIVHQSPQIHKITLHSQSDHRLAMNFGVLHSLFPQIQIAEPECVKKSFPNFWNVLAQVQNKPIVFIGSRGVGKTSLGRLLAQKLQKPFLDLDDILESQHKAISRLSNGDLSWEEFRHLEEITLALLLPAEGFVLATGGGTAESQKNQELLKKHAHLIYLNGDPAIVESWLQERNHQPLYQNSTKQDMEKRHKLYAPLADLEICSTPWDPESCIQEILTHLHG